MADQDYEVRIDGLVPTEGLLAELRDVRVAQHEFRTVLSGRFVDQAELYGFLNLLRSYGLEVVEVRRVPSATAEVNGSEADRDTEGDTYGDTGPDAGRDAGLAADKDEDEEEER